MEKLMRDDIIITEVDSFQGKRGEGCGTALPRAMVPNCEGLVTFKLQAVNRLHEFIQLEAPSLVFLMETGLKKKS